MCYTHSGTPSGGLNSYSMKYFSKLSVFPHRTQRAEHRYIGHSTWWTWNFRAWALWFWKYWPKKSVFSNEVIFQENITKVGPLLSVNQKRWIFTHLPSTNLQTVFLHRTWFFSFKEKWAPIPYTPPSHFSKFWPSHFMMLVPIGSWTSRRSDNMLG